ncbi:hypothetical protein [Paenibacillus apis]|uniref:Uncharacterized protein n=1 Tax=Paenibacillus apis TaxID=1792174 RepID=A0A919Y0V4_9BACL|nr:hypothetical protein [Paenibacillus apis]GIO42529.1 hypothetical protein J41TS4_22870 [Paenibacillus apis]
MEQRIKAIVEALKGLKHSDWLRVKQHIDMAYTSQAAKVKIDDLENVEKNLNREFKGYSQSE